MSPSLATMDSVILVSNVSKEVIDSSVIETLNASAPNSSGMEAIEFRLNTLSNFINELAGAMSKQMADLTAALIAHKEENARQHGVLMSSIDQVAHKAKVNCDAVKSSLKDITLLLKTKESTTESSAVQLQICGEVARTADSPLSSPPTPNTPEMSSRVCYDRDIRPSSSSESGNPLRAAQSMHLSSPSTTAVATTASASPRLQATRKPKAKYCLLHNWCDHVTNKCHHTIRLTDKERKRYKGEAETKTISVSEEPRNQTTTKAPKPTAEDTKTHAVVA